MSNHISRIKGKRAVSPLIATVLLIAFSVALGAVVMNWGRSFVKTKTEEVDLKTGVQLQCTVDILLEFVEISNEKQVCFNSTGNYTKFIVENTGSISSDGLSLQIIDSNSNIYSTQFTNTLAAGNASVFNYTNTALYGLSISYMSISPMILIPGTSTRQVCSSNKLEITDVNECD